MRSRRRAVPCTGRDFVVLLLLQSPFALSPLSLFRSFSHNVLRQIVIAFFASFLWGAGTALGEVPPYLVSRAAALAGESNAEFEEVSVRGWQIVVCVHDNLIAYCY